MLRTKSITSYSIPYPAANTGNDAEYDRIFSVPSCAIFRPVSYWSVGSFLSSSRAAVRPAMPAPTTITSKDSIRDSLAMSDPCRNAYTIANYLEKMNSKDKDFRFMAVSDLMAEFTKNNIKLDEDSERKVVRMLLRLLEDNNGEVQNLAVRCLGTIAGSVREYNCESVVDALCENMQAKTDELREVSSTALSCFIKAMPVGATATKIAQRLLPKLHSVLCKLSPECSAKNEVIDIIGEVLARNGSTLTNFHTEAEKVLLSHVAEGRPSVRKRAISALAHLAVAASSDLFNHIVNEIIVGLSRPKAEARTMMAALIALARACPQRFAAFIPTVVPLFLGYAAAEDDEQREIALNALETMIVRCPKESKEFYGKMEEQLKSALVHDPNYSYDEDEDEDMESTNGDGERRGAAPIGDEREDNVRSDIFSVYSAVMKRLAISRSSAVVGVVRAQLPPLLKAVVKIMKGKNAKARQQCFLLLSKVVRAVPNSLSPCMPELVEGATASLEDSGASSQMKIDVLVFLEDALPSHEAADFFSSTGRLVPTVSKGVRDMFYKVSSQALVVAAHLLDILHAKPGGVAEVEPLCSAIFDKLRGDVDQEVKEKAILAVGVLLRQFALGDKSIELLKGLVDRVNNEATQLTALKALSMVVDSAQNVSLLPVLPSLLPLLSQQLKKNSRAVKMSSLSLIYAICRTFPTALGDSAISDFLPLLPSLISEADLQICQLALRILTIYAVSCPARLSPSVQAVVAAITNLCRSSILQGATLNALLEFVATFVRTPVPGKPTFEQLLDHLSSPIYTDTQSSLSRQSIHSFAAVVAAVAASEEDQKNASKLGQKLAEQLNHGQATDANKLFALLTLGELGKRAPSIFEKAKFKVEEIILGSFTSPNEDIKSAGAIALGALVVGSLEKYLPFVLNQISTQPKRQYLLLHALKEVIAFEMTLPECDAAFVAQVDAVWAVLEKHADCAEEGTRCVVAECLGKLCHVNPALLLPRLEAHVSSPSVNMRAAVVTSVKFMITDEQKPIDDVLDTMMSSFLSAAGDENLDVRRVALVVLNSAAHNKPNLIRNRLAEVMPIVYHETNVRQELIREVEMGPFKHSVDDGLDLRKSAFECMYTLLDSCIDRLDLHTFIAALENGLKDQHDIKLLSYLILSKLATLAPNDLTLKLDKVCDPLKTQLNVKNKQNAVKAEMDKNEELKRAVLRTLIVLNKLPEGTRVVQLNELRSLVSNTTDLRTVYEALEKDGRRGGFAVENTVE
ncbi:cand-1 [Pristionchus pacificus]|uniref:Cand-1 n=1 Tax=Pristionchus pacificus TaxID=54126 RepID=A0A2A6C1F5_PRIPA|nr:cand-1 [Pristionchus pacificus]|eukprot:PDM72005.1 cand-1 [Pristionchus pacificus]